MSSLIQSPPWIQQAVPGIAVHCRAITAALPQALRRLLALAQEAALGLLLTGMLGQQLLELVLGEGFQQAVLCQPLYVTLRQHLKRT